jgi:transcriptional regulator with XRE-family HTH domain
VVLKKMPKLASELKLLNMQVKDLNRLKLVLVERKKTGLWLAEQLGVSNTTVSKWCTNTSQPDLQTLAQISDLLKVNIRELLVSRN